MVFMFIHLCAYTTMDKEEQVMSLGCGDDMKKTEGGEKGNNDEITFELNKIVETIF